MNRVTMISNGRIGRTRTNPGRSEDINYMGDINSGKAKDCESSRNQRRN